MTGCIRHESGAVLGHKRKSILLVGAGGHACVVLDALRLSGFDGQVSVHADQSTYTDLLGAPIVVGMPTPDMFAIEKWSVHVAIGNTAIRARECQKFLALGYELATICHPKAVISPFAKIADGSSILANAVVNPRAKIGRAAIINTGAIVEHDCTLGDYVHISPGAVLAGNCQVDDLCWIGANAVLREGTRVKEQIIVGANAMVSADLKAAGTYVGTPAKRMQKD